MKYSAIAQNGSLQMQSEFMRENFKKFLHKHEGARIEFIPVTPESRKQRGMYHAAYIPLWAYLDGKNHRDYKTLEALHEIAKLEFNGDMMIVGGKPKKYGKSTKQELNTGFMNRMLDYLVENYGINPQEVLNPEAYKKWRDEIYPRGGPDNYVDYLVEVGKLKKSNV